MYKNQLQELAQRSCFNLPSYACIREGPDHAPRFKASVNFNGEIFESPAYCTTLRQAEHAAAEAALNALSTRGPSRSLTARVLDETGVYKNLLQETAHRAGLNLPVYTTVRSGPGHVPVFTSRVDLAGITFTGEPAKTKKQAEKNAAIAAWSALKTSMPNLGLLSQTSKDTENGKHQDQVIMARLLCKNKGSKDEERAIGGYQTHCRRRMARNHRDNGSNDHIVRQKQLRLIDLFADSTSEGSIEKQNSFVSLLPPPPPRTSSRILPQTSSRDCEFPCQTAARPNQIQVKGKEIAASPLDDLRRDEDEWLHGKSEVIKKTIEIEEDPDPSKSKSRVVHRGSPAYRLFEPPNNEKVMNITLPLQHQTQDNAQTQMRTGLHGPKTASKMKVSAIKASTCNHMVMRSPFSSGYHYHPQKIAPAVQVRSVIPVCAAPPPPVTTYLSNSPLIKEVVASPSDTTTQTQTAAEVLPSSQPKFNSPQFYSTFNKLHL